MRGEREEGYIKRGSKLGGGGKLRRQLGPVSMEDTAAALSRAEEGEGDGVGRRPGARLGSAQRARAVFF